MWLERCGRGDLLPLLSTLKSVPANFLLCHKHFDKKQFANNSDGSKKRRLIPHALPTIFVKNKPLYSASIPSYSPLAYKRGRKPGRPSAAGRTKIAGAHKRSLEYKAIVVRGRGRGRPRSKHLGHRELSSLQSVSSIRCNFVHCGKIIQT